MIISTQIVAHGLAPPICAASRCVQVATGPYTDGVCCHCGLTSIVYGLFLPPGRSAGRNVYGL